MCGCTQKEIVFMDQTTNLEKNCSTDNTIKIEQFVEDLYGKNNLNLGLDKIFMIQDLIETIENLSEQEKKIVAATTLQIILENINQASDLQKTIYSYIALYLQQYSGDEQDLEKCLEKNNVALLKTAQKIIDYIHLEQTDIFSNTKNLYLFTKYLQQKSDDQTMQLPKLINFWSNETGQKIINHLDPTDAVKIQGFITGMLIDMSIMLAAQTGASMANAGVTTQLQQLATLINKNSKTAQTNMQAFQTQLQKDQQTKLQAMISAFSQAQQNIQSQVSQAINSLNAELDYLYKNISLEQPQQNYIFNQISYDQLFTLGTMLTPQGPLWKNPFCIGDWQYEKDDNSFWQYQNNPLLHTKTDSSGKSTTSSLQAENNSIFAEYVTENQTYTIAGTITVYAVSYPFFVGIMFNKARWISGDFESIRKCRMVGIYGASNQKINAYFAQQYTMNDKQIEASPSEDPIQTPLQQIINNKIQPILPIAANSFTSISTSPVVINFSITNAPTTVTIQISINNNTSKIIKIDKLDDQIYMHHGIGCICPGAIAQFNFTEPSDFIFSQQAISNYKD